MRSQTTRRRPYRTHNKKGRSLRPGRFVMLHHYMLNSDAWRSLKPYHRALYVELAMRFNGLNNGEIAFSVRQAARQIHTAKDTASKAFRELAAKGFIKINQPGSFDWKLRHATTWILTEHPLGEDLATKEFMKWRPENSKPGPKSEPKCTNSGTPNGKLAYCHSSDVPQLGSSNSKSSPRRSQSKGHI